VPVGNKICTKCGIEKEFSDFNKNKGGRFGLFSHCKKCKSIWQKQWDQENHEHRMNQQRIRLQSPENKEKHLNAFTEWRKKNLKYDSFRASLRRSYQMKQRPIWADLEKIKQVYLNCPKGYHVDHIVPLKGKFVSGLHVENNLQYLQATENMKKRNFYAIGTT
jgi:uncharacterized protein YfbU (UPF0304 family)